MAVTIQTHATIDEAQRAMSSSPGSRFFAGGTILMIMVNYGNQSLGNLIRCSDPSLREIRMEGDRIRIGAAVTMNQIMANRDLAYLAPIARAVGGPAIRSAATVGGNLFASPPYGDFATGLLALGATVEQAGGNTIPIDDFLRDRDRNRDRIVTAVLVPRPSNRDALRFLKVTRVKPKGASVVAIAAYPAPSGGRVNEIRVAYGNMAPVPIRATAVEQALKGASLDETGIAPAISAACNGIEPVDDALASSWYRREVIPVHLKRLLLNRTA